MSKINLNLGIKKSTKIMLAIILILIIALIIVWPRTDKEQKPTTVIAGCMTDVGEYTFQKYHYTYVDEFKDPQKLFNVKIPLTTKSFVYAIPGTISYGFDMTTIAESDVNINNGTKKITINMPEMYIIAHEQDSKSMKIYAEDNNIFNLIKSEDFKSVLVKAKKETEADAIGRGVIAETQNNAASMIENMIKVLDEYSDYDVKFNFVEQKTVKHIDDISADE